MAFETVDLPVAARGGNVPDLAYHLTKPADGCTKRSIVVLFSGSILTRSGFQQGDAIELQVDRDKRLVCFHKTEHPDHRARRLSKMGAARLKWVCPYQYPLINYFTDPAGVEAAKADFDAKTKDFDERVAAAKKEGKSGPLRRPTLINAALTVLTDQTRNGMVVARFTTTMKEVADMRAAART